MMATGGTNDAMLEIKGFLGGFFFLTLSFWCKPSGYKDLEIHSVIDPS
jgi:hypothetical protein